MATTTKTKVAILGGGPGALATAFELTRSQERRDRYEVTIYQQGWRLGGKCASGREGENRRILEHGLHMLLGFYDTTFRLLRECYDEWHDRHPGASPFPTFVDALERQNQITLQERVPKGASLEWKSWNVAFRPPEGIPGDSHRPSLLDLLTSLVDYLAQKHRQVRIERFRWRALRSVFRALTDTEKVIGRVAMRLTPSSPMEKALGQVRRLDANRPHLNPVLLLEILKLLELATAAIGSLEAITEDDLRHDVLLLRLGCAAASGLIRDVMLHGEDFARIDPFDFREWLMKHGATADDVNSPPIKALYDLGFAYVDGEPDKPQAAAGVALYVALRTMFGCRGALLWKMKAGAGDILFAPLYEVLKARGVQFRFFHRVEKLRLSQDRTKVQAIEVAEQAKIKKDAEYEPLVEVPYRGSPTKMHCWPSEPLWDQIVEGTKVAGELSKAGLSFESGRWERKTEPITLEAGRHFDVAVLCIPIGALPDICRELMEARPAWKTMVEGIRTVATQSLQLWMKPDLEGLGWKDGSTVSISYVEPFDAWGEMSHLLPAEPWPEGRRPGSIHYFCNALPWPPRDLDDNLATARAEKHVGTFLDSALGHLWPRSVDARGRFDASLEMGRYVRANVDFSERYALSVPNSISVRLLPDCSTFSNLYLAGDWVLMPPPAQGINHLNSGSVEAAMTTGVYAANAIDRIVVALLDSEANLSDCDREVA